MMHEAVWLMLFACLVPIIGLSIIYFRLRQQ